MQLAEGILIVNIDACGVERADEVGGSGGNFATEGFKLASLLEELDEVCTGAFQGAEMYWEDGVFARSSWWVL